MARSEQLKSLSATMGAVETVVDKIRVLEPKHRKTAIAYARDLLDEIDSEAGERAAPEAAGQ